MPDHTYAAIQQRFAELASFASGIIPHDIGGPCFEPEMSDANEINTELDLIASRVDALLLAYAERARSYGILTKADVEQRCKSIMSDALDEMKWLIEEGTRSRMQERDDEAEKADHDYRLAREDA